MNPINRAKRNAEADLNYLKHSCDRKVYMSKIKSFRFALLSSFRWLLIACFIVASLTLFNVQKETITIIFLLFMTLSVIPFAGWIAANISKSKDFK